jgi:hypothetical protein
MSSYPHDDSVGPSRAAEAPDQLEPVVPAPGGDAQDAHGASADAGRRPTHVATLLAEVARAMQAAAAQERERIHAGMAEDETLQVEKVRARATAESAALRKGADDDVRNVESWCEEQIRRIRAEADRRIVDRRQELEQSVTQHGELIETEVQSVHGAIQGYRDSLDAFFARMAEESDPSAIAGLAGTLPDPPDLDAVRAHARSRAMKALEEQESAQSAASSTDGLTDPRDTDPLTAEPVAVMDPAPATEPTPVMDPAANASSNENAAIRVIRSLASRTPPPQAQR